MEHLAAAAPADYSLIALFARASITVKVVMALLLVASFWSWAIIVQKAISFAGARRDSARFDREFWSGQPLDDVYDRLGARPSGGAQRIFAAGMAEWRKSQTDQGSIVPAAQSRIDRAMNVAISREADRLGGGLTFLATVGSTAPFVGLFGTVWGIKTAFEEIAMTQNTSLAVVAPGIAEALVATALGLAAAIPSVVAYNKFTADAERITGAHEAFADEFSTLLSRQIGED